MKRRAETVPLRERPRKATGVVMTSKDPGYYDYDPKASVTCASCGWRGPAEGHEEFFREVLEVKCPECSNLILVVPYPTLSETREVAAAGYSKAQDDLVAAAYVESRTTRAKRLQLEWPEQLPDLPGSEWIIDWDYEEIDREHWTILRHQGREIWREIAFFEGHWRFAQVLALLRQRYGVGLLLLRPTRPSELFLYGDDLAGPRRIARMNATLRDAGTTM